MVTIIEDKSGGYFITENDLMDRCLRVIGPGPFIVYCLFKRMCAGNKQSVFPNVDTKSWAEYAGMSNSSFITNVRILEKHRLLEVKRPKGTEKLNHRPNKYTLLPPNDLRVLKRDHPKPLSKTNKFNDLFYNPEEPLFRDGCKLQLPTVVNLDHRTSEITTANSISTNKGISTEKDISIKNRTYSKLSERLRDIIIKNNSTTIRPRTYGWFDYFRKLHEIDGVALHRIHTVLDWYEDHMGKPYVPECYSARSFREKFPKLESAIKREEGNGKGNTSAGHAKPIPGKYDHLNETIEV